MANEFVARNGLIAQNNSIVTGSLTVTQGITGSLFGTASYALSSSYTLSSSFATTASYVNILRATGSDSQIQYNNNGLLGASSNLSYDGNLLVLGDGLIYQGNSLWSGIIGPTGLQSVNERGIFNFDGDNSIPFPIVSYDPDIGRYYFADYKVNYNPINTSLTITGSLRVTGSTQGGGSGHILTYNTASGEIFYTASSAITVNTASYAVTASYVPNLGGLLIFRNGSDGVATVSGASTITYSQLIPANTFNTSDIFKLYFRARKTGTANIFTMRFYVNTTNNLVGATQMGIYQSDNAARLYNQMYRTYAIKNNTNNTEAYPTTTNNFYDENISSVAVTSLNINWTQQQYIIFNVVCTSASDTAVGSYFRIEKF